MNEQVLFYLGIGSAAFVFILTVFLVWQIFLLRRRLELFSQGSKAGNLEGILAEQGKRMRELEQEFKRLRDDVARLDVMATASIQKVGLVRFNPFSDTGGDQSFALAFLDSEDNGVVVSSLHSREGTRIYSKPIVRRESKYHLSDEEREAIRRALARE